LSDADYPGVFSQADCFIHAGTAELQSIVTLEAIASGLPVVAAKSVALPELVHHGLNGFLFEPQNSLEAAGFICKILKNSDLKMNMAKNSLNIAKQHDIVLTGEKFVALYKQATKYHQYL
jgi:glycosyltransferase involved in cell wall biosynthesis